MKGAVISDIKIIFCLPVTLMALGSSEKGLLSTDSTLQILQIIQCFHNFMQLHLQIKNSLNPAGMYLFKVRNGNSRTRR